MNMARNLYNAGWDGVIRDQQGNPKKSLSKTDQALKTIADLFNQTLGEDKNVNSAFLKVLGQSYQPTSDFSMPSLMSRSMGLPDPANMMKNINVYAMQGMKLDYPADIQGSPQGLDPGTVAALNNMSDDIKLRDVDLGKGMGMDVSSEEEDKTILLRKPAAAEEKKEEEKKEVAPQVVIDDNEATVLIKQRTPEAKMKEAEEIKVEPVNADKVDNKDQQLKEIQDAAAAIDKEK